MSPSEAEIRAIVHQVLNRLMSAAPEDPQAGQAAAEPAGGRTLVDEAAVRDLAPGSTLRVPPAALVTPLAREAARARGITLDEGHTTLAAGLRPTASKKRTEDPSTVSRESRGTGSVGGNAAPPAQRVALGADHGGFALKEALKPHLQSLGYEVVDCGTHSADAVDYPDIAYAVARWVAGGSCANGIIIDGAGIGSCMAANKVPGIRAALCYDHATATNSREHNHANVLTLGAGLIGLNLAKQIVQTWLATPYAAGRHAQRVEKIMAIEQRYAGAKK